MEQRYACPAAAHRTTERERTLTALPPGRKCPFALDPPSAQGHKCPFALDRTLARNGRHVGTYDGGNARQSVGQHSRHRSSYVHHDAALIVLEWFQGSQL
jgi:hypothetical protein